MFRWIIGSSLQFRVLFVAAAAALMVFGVLRLQRMPVDVFPEFGAPTVEVQTEAIGLSAKEVEGLITLNLEELLSGVPWLESIRSSSVTGLSSIVLTFKRGTDLVKARQMMQERLTLAYTLPNVSTPPVILQPVSATGRFMMIGISSQRVEATELSLLARWTIKPKLLGVPGVANVSIWGQRLRQMHVHIDPERLRDARLLQDDIIATAGDALWVSPLTFLKGSAPGTGGWIDNANQRLGVQHQMPIRSPEDMAKVAVGAQHLTMTGKTMALGEVAEVTFSHPPLIGDAIVDNGAGLMLVVEKLPSANTLEVTRGVDQALAELGRGLPGVKIDPTVFRLASYIEEGMTNLAWALAAGALLLVAALAALLYNWRVALVAVVAIPLSLVAALLALALTGATFNTMMVAGLMLALAVLIDDATVDAERVMQRLRGNNQEAHQQPVASLIYRTVLETRGSALYATLIVILAVTPVFFMGGVSGAFFEPLATAFVLAAAASMLVALAVTPALTLVLIGRSARELREPPLAAWLQQRYETLLRKAIEKRKGLFVGAAAAVALGLALAPLLGQSLLPAFKERQLLVNLATAPGTSYAETHRITSRMSRELRALPGVRNVGAHIGRAVTGDQVVGINSSQIWISLDKSADRAAALAAIRETIDGYPGVERNIQSFLRDRIGEVLTGASNAIVVRLYGPQREVLAQKAEELRKLIADIPGIVDLRAEGQVEEPHVQVRVDLDRAGQAGIKPGDVRRASATVFSGLTVGFLFEDQKIYDVVVWGAPETRSSLSNLSDLWVGRTERQTTRLRDVADVAIMPTPTVLRHEAIAPYIDVVANVAGRDLGRVADQVDDRLDRMQFPLEHNPKLLGEYAEREHAQERMLGIALAAALGIFLLLQACLRSWRLAAVAFLAIPASMAGAVLAAAASGGVLSLGALVGALAVLGIATRNGLLLIEHYQRLEGEGMPFGLDLVVRGARERLLPIVTSAAVIVAAVAPMVALGPVAGLEILQPTAVVIIGGLIASTLLTLGVTPAVYLALGAGTRREPELALGGEWK
jgi:CzcA family heavy metal efflux pump